MSADAIRPASPADAPAVAACVNAAYAHYIGRIGKPPAPMLADYEALIAQGVVHVLPGDTGLRGVLVAFPLEGSLFIENVAVDPRCQGQGLGARLMAFAEALARAGGLAALTLYTHELMTENVRYYGKLGYAETSRRVEDGYHRIYMRKDLAPPRTAESGH